MGHARVSIVIAVMTATLLSGKAEAALSGTSASLAPSVAQPKAAPKPQPLVRRDTSSVAFDGGWAVRTSGGCMTSGSSFVAVSNGCIRGEGLSGTIDAGGNIRTLGRAGSLAVVSSGRAAGNSAAGVFRESTGCSGTWTAQRR